MSDEVFVHPTASIDEPVKIGPGSKIWHSCHLMSGARIGGDVVLGQNGFVGGTVVVGDGCRIQNNVSLFDGVILGERVFVGPSVVFTNVRRPRAGFPRKDAFEQTQVDADATIGANATVVCGVHIGRAAMVAAGSVVTRSVQPFTLVAGVPAAPKGFVCLCGERLDHELSCACGREYALTEGGFPAPRTAGDPS